jgi:hypothetical protein
MHANREKEKLEYSISINKIFSLSSLEHVQPSSLENM